MSPLCWIRNVVGSLYAMAMLFAALMCGPEGGDHW